jgi:hypothetical protein
MLWSREDEGAMSHCKHRNVNSDARQPGPADEAPDNSRKIPVGKREMLETELRMNMTPGLNSKARPFRREPVRAEPACLDYEP